jgi:hypothetical protein
LCVGELFKSLVCRSIHWVQFLWFTPRRRN